MSDFMVGDLVRYVPTHAQGDEKHADCETGIVTSVGASGTVFVLFSGSTSQGCYPDSLVLKARSDWKAFLLQTCQRGHKWFATQLEVELYRGTPPLPCPICTREGLRDRAGT